MSDEPKDEIGRPLRADELKPKQIVAIAPPGHPGMLLTMWVEEVRDNLVVFFAGEINVHVINIIRQDGELVDDADRVVRVFEYLGEP